MEFVTSNGWKISGEAIKVVIMVTDRVREGNLGKVTTFCCHDQAKMEASDALSALCQCNSPEPSVIVVRRYTNTPYIPWGFSHLPYLDMSTPSGGTSSTQFPLHWLCLHRLLPFFDTEVVLPQEEGEMELKVFPHFSMAKLRRWAPPLWPNFTVSPFISPSSPSRRGHSMEGGLGFHPAFKLLQDVNQARGQLGCALAQETLELAQRYDDRWINLSRRHDRQWAWMVKHMDATIHEVFFQGSSADSIKLLPWCISSAVPSTTWVEHWPLPCNRMRMSQLPSLHLILSAHQLLGPQAVQIIHTDLQHIQYLPYQVSPL